MSATALSLPMRLVPRPWLQTEDCDCEMKHNCGEKTSMLYSHSDMFTFITSAAHLSDFCWRFEVGWERLHVVLPVHGSFWKPADPGSPSLDSVSPPHTTLHQCSCSLQGVLPAGGLVCLPPCGQFWGLQGGAGSQVLAHGTEESILLWDFCTAECRQEILSYEGWKPVWSILG